MSIEAEIATRFQELSEQLINAARDIESGKPPFDADPKADLLRLVSSHFFDGAPDLWSRYLREAIVRPEEAVLDKSIARVVFDILSNSGHLWEGSVDEFLALAAEIEDGFVLDADELDGRHWVGRALALAGALVYISPAGVVRLRRQIGFGRCRLASPPAPVPPSPRGSNTRLLALRGSWVARGLSPDLCAYCMSAPFEEIEHFVPLSRGGTHDPDNLFPACQMCNRGRRVGKFDRDPWEWLEQHHPSRVEFFSELLR